MRIHTAETLKGVIEKYNEITLGYPAYFSTTDGCAVSIEWVEKNLADEMINIKMNSFDKIDGLFINYEYTDLFCNRTGEKINCAYIDEEE